MSKLDELRRLREARAAGSSGSGKGRGGRRVASAVMEAAAEVSAAVGWVPPVNEGGRRRGRPSSGLDLTWPVRLSSRLGGLVDEEAGRRGLSRSETIRVILDEVLGGGGR